MNSEIEPLLGSLGKMVETKTVRVFDFFKEDIYIYICSSV